MLELTIHAGDSDWESPLVTAFVPRDQMAGVLQEGPVSGQREATACVLRLATGGQTIALFEHPENEGIQV